MKHIDIVFSGLPDARAPTFIEVEDDQRRSIKVGEWLQRVEDSHYVLRINRQDVQSLEVDPVGHDPEFTGEQLHRLVLDIEAAVGRNSAGATPLGTAVMMLAERVWREYEGKS